MASGTFTFTAQQGEVMKRPGEMDVSVEVENGRPQSVAISGKAAKVFQTTIPLVTLPE